MIFVGTGGAGWKAQKADVGVSAFWSFQPKLGPAGASRSKTSIQVNYTEVKYRHYTSNRVLRLECGCFPVSCGVNFLTLGFLWCKFLDIWFLVHLTIKHFYFWFRPFEGKIVLSSKSTGKRSHLVHFGYCHHVIKYLMHDMMNYHCQREVALEE